MHTYQSILFPPSLSLVMSEYSEYDEGELQLEQGTPTNLVPILSDDPESYARQQARRRHLQRSRSRGSESSVKDRAELKRHSSKTDLHRQLSKQKSVEAGEKATSPAPTERTALILEEKVETGSVSSPSLPPSFLPPLPSYIHIHSTSPLIFPSLFPSLLLYPSLPPPLPPPPPPPPPPPL